MNGARVLEQCKASCAHLTPCSLKLMQLFFCSSFKIDILDVHVVIISELTLDIFESDFQMGRFNTNPSKDFLLVAFRYSLSGFIS